MDVEGSHHGGFDVERLVHEIDEGKCWWRLRTPAVTVTVQRSCRCLLGVVCVVYVVYVVCDVCVCVCVQVKPIAPKPPSIVMFHVGKKGIVVPLISNSIVVVFIFNINTTVIFITASSF